MISEDHVTMKTGVMPDENVVLRHRNELHFECIKIENQY